MKIELFNRGNETLARTLEDVSYKYTSKNKEITVFVKEGFIFDGASIPKVLWGIIGSPFSGKYRMAALIHDALYTVHDVDRKEADDIFFNQMKAEGVARWRMYAMYSAVRFFGGSSYRTDSHYSIDEAREFIIITKVAL